MRNIIAIDIGGTSIRAALVRNNKIIKKCKQETKISKGKNYFIKTLFSCIESVKDGKINGIGIGCPGPTNYETGRIINPPNLKPLHGLNLKKIIKNKFKVRVEMENDANCAAIAELKNRKEKNFLVLTLGTGIGCGIIINKQLYKGKGYASELGHMIIDSKKDLEDLASGTAISTRASKVFNKRLMASELVKLCKKGNKRANRVVKKSASYLGIGLANISNIFDPEVIILTGGMKEAGNYYLNLAKKEMEKYTLLKSKVVWSQIKDAGLLGASYLI